MKVRHAVPFTVRAKTIIVRDGQGVEVARVVYAPNLLGDAVWVMANSADCLEVEGCKS